MKGSRLVKPNGSVNMSDNSLKYLNCNSASCESTVKEKWNSSLKYPKKSGRHPRISGPSQNSPYARNSPRHERSRTEDPSVANFRKNKLLPVSSRLSMPGRSGLNSPVYSDADAWITDCIAEKPATKTSEGRWLAKKNKVPYLGSYQLIGDSLFVRFSDQILKSPAVIGANGKFCNGHCVSGQTISELDQRLSTEFALTNVMVLIGTNDFLRRSSFHEMQNDMKSLLNLLAYSSEKVVLLTVPPIPRLENTPGHWALWEKYNEWLKTLDNGTTIKVIDIVPLFMIKTRTPDLKAFESHMGFGGKRRVDLIHLNRLGLLRLHAELKKQLEIE
ncbi:uncharacterized protein [Hetaerina americana]|uniref:uncharacterized protein n=1 Tax=Hetaerina americana TaxID=62018 RepID=UPI003A7F5AE2